MTAVVGHAGRLIRHFSLQSPAEVKWAHAVNSLELLQRACDSKVHMIEADVRSLPSEGKTLPILRHDPLPAVVDASSLCTFDAWLQQFLAHAAVKSTTSPQLLPGLKLDFKDPDAVETCLTILLTRLTQSSVTLPALWLNADILQGPGGGASPFDPTKFILTCSQVNLPDVVLSIGWTTGAPPEDQKNNEASALTYHTASMQQLCQEQKLVEVTFPVRLRCISASWEQSLKPLLNSCPNYTLTVWKGRFAAESALEAADRQWIKEHLPPFRTFIDLDY